MEDGAALGKEGSREETLSSVGSRGGFLFCCSFLDGRTQWTRGGKYDSYLGEDKEGEGKVRKRRQVAIGGKEGKGDDRCRK